MFVGVLAKLSVDRKTAQLILGYCVVKFGVNPLRPIPKICVRRNESKTYGCYSLKTNAITLYAHTHEQADNPVYEFVDTIIHEYKHYLQAVESGKFSYTDQHEKEAIKFSNKHSTKFKELFG